MNYSIPKSIGFCLHLVCGFILIGLCAHHASARETAIKRHTPVRTGQSPLPNEEIREEMEKYLGVRYRKAGASKKGFDCSGFVKVIYDEIFGVDLPHQSSQQALSPELMTVSEDALKTGDLIFFSTGRNKKAISHVGIYLADGKFIHAARSKGVVVSNLDDPYWRRKIVRMKRLVGRDLEDVVVATESAVGVAFPVGEQSTLSFRHEQMELPALSPVLFEKTGSEFDGGDQLGRVEVDLARVLRPSLVSHFTAFREYAFTADQRKPLGYHPILEDPSAPQSFGAYAQGLKLSGGIRPTGSFYITPSLSYLDYGPGVDDAALPKFALGLNFDFFSPSNGWSLSTGLHMPIRRYASSLPIDEMDEHSIDLSLTYRQQLSDHVQLSVTGDNFVRFTPGVKRSSSGLDPEDQHFSLMLHLSY
jgi:hypothetical protein